MKRCPVAAKIAGSGYAGFFNDLFTWEYMNVCPICAASINISYHTLRMENLVWFKYPRTHWRSPYFVNIFVRGCQSVPSLYPVSFHCGLLHDIYIKSRIPLCASPTALGRDPWLKGSIWFHDF